MLQDPNPYTVSLGLNTMKGLYFTDRTGMRSMALVSIVPMLVIFVQGIAGGGMK